MKITVVGVGYVGLANAVLFAQNHPVTAVDINEKVVDILNSGRPHIQDDAIERFMKEKDLDFTATTDAKSAYQDTDLVVIATPTNYDEDTNHFDTSSVEAVIREVIAVNPDLPIVIKSTIPVGYTASLQAEYDKENIIFSPEFLREGRALEDNLYPSRIIVSGDLDISHQFAALLVEGALKDEVPVLFMPSDEAEAVKLFANTYLAMRVAFFNELDSYAELKGLDARSIIDGVGLDPRIGDHYNNPSFGYGGYCLPKDTKQLLANFDGVPNDIVAAIVDANKTRKAFIAQSIIDKQPQTVGVYRLVMKEGSDNFRASSIIDVADIVADAGIEVVVYEPGMDEDNKIVSHRINNDLDSFLKESDLIIANRLSDELESVRDKVYTRDLYTEN